MKKPDTPRDEASRLNALRSLDILDTPPEERFDRLTRLAKRMFDVPIALVSLVDEDRQWFKSCVGLDVSETPRDISFCGHAILGNEPFIVNDTAKDPRFADNPLVVDAPGIGFYAGCPLRHHDGSKMGTLCIIDGTPRTLGKEDVEALQDLAEMAERELAAVQLATLDELTRISNRMGFVTLAQNSVDLCVRSGIPASLVFFDLNGFKPINDTFGHAEGDRALVAFADHMKHTFRDSDVFARLGGDEFVVLLTNTSHELAIETISRFRQSIERYNKETNRGYDISFSEGIVTVDAEHNHSMEELLSNADSLMYEKKRAVA
ncbi:MAG: sensor domain-containing diguanylate cyclase [Gammaproteobacteria bacterium]